MNQGEGSKYIVCFFTFKEISEICIKLYLVVYAYMTLCMWWYMAEVSIGRDFLPKWLVFLAGLAANFECRKSVALEY